MIKVVGIRFQRAGKIYYFDPLDYDLETAMHVIVETARGVEMGTVMLPPKEVDDDKVVQTLNSVIRIATDDDEKVIEKYKEQIMKDTLANNIFYNENRENYVETKINDEKIDIDVEVVR